MGDIVLHQISNCRQTIKLCRCTLSFKWFDLELCNLKGQVTKISSFITNQIIDILIDRPLYMKVFHTGSRLIARHA